MTLDVTRLFQLIVISLFLGIASDTQSSGHGPVMLVDEGLNVLKFKTHHAFLPLAAAWAGDTDTRKPALARQFVNKGQAAFKNPAHVLRG
jgi:hypothetical protein